MYNIRHTDDFTTNLNVYYRLDRWYEILYTASMPRIFRNFKLSRLSNHHRTVERHGLGRTPADIRLSRLGCIRGSYADYVYLNAVSFHMHDHAL